MTKPKVCPPEEARIMTNAKNAEEIGSREGSKWDWGLLCDLAYVADCAEGTVRKNVERLMTGLSEDQIVEIFSEK